MYMAQPGHIDHIKQVNAGRVYKLIDLKGPISRIDLSKQSGLRLRVSPKSLEN